MSATYIGDIIVPEVFAPYFIEKTAEKSNLISSGIVVPDPAFDILARTGGKTINMPFFTDLDGDDEVLDDGDDYDGLTVQGIGAKKDIAVLNGRGAAWGASDLAKALSGADPMAAIADRVAAFWARKEQSVLINTLTGIFADNVANDSSSLVYDVSVEAIASQTDEAMMGASTLINALQTIYGDSLDRITAIMMHSAVFARLQNLKLVEWDAVAADTRVEVGQKANTMQVPSFMGKRIVVDDGCPTEAGTTDGTKYTSYLFGAGAIARGEGAAPVPVETDRDKLKGEDILITRRHFILHPRGIAFDGTPAGEFPTNTELATADNWTRKYEAKNIRVAQVVTNG